ncbi:hypothetical protein BHYA_0096g00360 [Botrytis hyacinthi]|uniref:DUF6697 domain-containing protein n=1 Tax=Botrytis hyacinthi TaxID=278943 RepID=A0A4Z1GVS3_9HELO|nr:hypothetical protein BHYA_0096g00360 [Botrytis hyacinthi]
MSEITSNGTRKRKLTKSCERDAAIIDLPNETLPPKAPGRSATSVAQAAQLIENARPDMDKVGNGNTTGFKTELGSLVVIDLTDDEVLSPVKREHRSNDSDVINVLFEVTPVPEMPESVQNVSENAVQMPTMMRRMPLTQNLHLPPQPHTKFEYRFLRDSLGGRRTTDGWYSSNGSEGAFANIGPCCLMNREFDPLLPCLPGVHGAQISPYLPPNKISQTFPLFISDIGDSHFQYYGTYEVMVSDHLGHNQMFELPEQIKRHWARKLGAGSAHDSMSRTITKEEAQDITEGAVMAAFDRHDLDDPLGVSLYYEYLKCVGYDLELYHTLVTNMNEL